MTLPTLSEIYRIGFSSTHYGKQPYTTDTASPHTLLEDNDEGNVHEIYDYSKHSERSIPQGLDGSLERLMTMPDDIMYEIFNHLHPRDVLSLSRTSKTLHAFLNEDHARGIWRSSLATVRALPLCPPDMTEPQYACLAFDDWCHFCLAPGVQDIAWVCRVRCCQKCIKEQFISEDELDLWLPEDIYIEKPDAIFPFLLTQKRAVGRNKPMYHLRSAREYLRQLDFLKGDAALAEWSQQKKEKQALRVQHAAMCEHWYTHWAFRSSNRPAVSYIWELALIIWLSVLLMGLWQDKLLELFACF